MYKKSKLDKLKSETLEEQCKRLCYETFKDFYKLPEGCNTYEEYIRYYAHDLFFVENNEIYAITY
ncbi:TPA: hypothetical protein ACG0NJ_001880 [Clostridium perfringens]|uniref:hypothetical protein n=1 Tax=Clostridium perfringens TaxID=1502 RepID=UPI001CB56D12|nr:hypothetical protein [Clostridium perfringens]MDM0558291.1 hypothetical protein [Clostridium perfringens]MDU3334595.1 hypothetical protein [Clostridium perfringens]HBI6905078.1 hypothetical protein [Clostridium perfringens]